ncbi:MAG: transcriptional repressor [Spirochaetaceae bacterium]|nr:transcriptional repressor [Spirochaetaceae bacterium]
MERRKTKQRDSVFDAVMKLNHPTAQELYDYIVQQKKTGPFSKKISMGTVYRNLQILEETGKLTPVYSDPLVVHYDARLDPHYHVQCKKCGSVYDMPMDYLNALNKMAQETCNWTVESHSLAFMGVCPDCLQTTN